MKIVFTASEAAPFIKTGGLGDVAQALPEALSKTAGNEIILFLPYYHKIKYESAFPVEFVTSFAVDLSWRKQHAGVFKLKSRRKKFSVYFIDNEYYFNREKEYGYPDDGERFAYFSKAVCETMKVLGIVPDIIHCNDWQSALIPVFVHAFYEDQLGKAKTVFTIHNIEYQGKADPYFLGDTLGLPASYENTLMYDGCINFMKGAILCSDHVTTVSETYAQELKYPYYAHGLSQIIEEHGFKITGIVNGIDTAVNDPAGDPGLFRNYDVSSFITGKAENKAKLQKKLGLAPDPDAALIGMVSRMVSHKGMDLICGLLPELMNWNIQFAALGTGDKEYENCLREIAARFPDKCSVNTCFDPKLASLIYAASDIYMMPSKSEPCGLSQMIAMRYGTVPVVNATGGLKDTVIPYDPEKGEGLGFTFQSFNKEDLTDALRRCLSIYGGDKAGWNKIITNDMKADFSWKKPAEEYMKLYSSLIF